MKEVKEYIRCFKDDNEYNEKRNGDYYEPWLSLTKKGIGDVKSFIGEYDEESVTVEQQFNYFGSYGDEYVNTDIIESNITAIDGENHTVTVDGYVFNFRNSQDNKYFFNYIEPLIATETVESLDGVIEFNGNTYSACTVSGRTFIMDYYDSGQGIYYWDEVDIATSTFLNLWFSVDHEALTVGETVEVSIGELMLNGYTSEEPAVGVLFKYIDTSEYIMRFISDNGRHVQVGDTNNNITVKSIVETEEGETINRVNYNKTEYEKQLEVPLTFDIQSNGNIVVGSQNYNLEYKKNDGEWINVKPVSESEELGLEVEIPVVSGDTIQFRGNNSNGINNSIFSGTTSQFIIKGNIMSLINPTDFSTLTTLESYYAFSGLFKGCTGLTDASELILPATTLASYCYDNMFSGCTSLTTAPQLPATTLASYCYRGMFYGCTSLTEAPELPATTLAIYCYQDMFGGCTNLTTAPELPATTLAGYCYGSMFGGCTNLTTAPELPATTLANRCYSSMFAGCTNLTTAPELPATTLATWCYASMFGGCTNLTTAPALPATTLASYCYSYMFSNCASLTTASQLPATTLASNCYEFMFQGCASLTTAPALPATTLTNNCYHHMFRGCTSLTTAPELPATTLTNSCYERMFEQCTSLTTAPELPATTLTTKCYSGMFYMCNHLNYIKCLATDISASACTYYWVYGVAGTGTFVAADRATLWKRGFNGIPTNWNIQYVDERMSIVPLTFEIRSSGTIRWKASNTAYTATLQYNKNGDGWRTIKSTTGGTTISVVSGDIVQFRGDNATMCDKSFRYNSFNGTIGQFVLKGNIMSLINSTGFSELSTLTSASTFYNLFNNCTGLTDASELLLPATTLTEYCYANMFIGCTSLTKAPALPATTLANSCYSAMFQSTSLTTAPELPATTLANQCYDNMFRNCASLTTAPELPATTLANSCYQYMFYNCRALKTVPILPATTLVNGCYRYMFNGCSNLNYIKCLATDISAANCTYYWVQGVASTGTFVKNPNMTNWTTGISGIPTNWTIQDAS